VWRFWQWSNQGDGREYGASSTYIDLNYFNGTAAQLDEYAAPPTPPHSWNKTVILCPKNFKEDEYWKVAINEAYPIRTEVAFSADSAFAPQTAVSQHRVIVYNVEAWGGQAALEAWVLETYGRLPDIEYRSL
jgi:hypothetical protein